MSGVFCVHATKPFALTNPPLHQLTTFRCYSLNKGIQALFGAPCCSEGKRMTVLGSVKRHYEKVICVCCFLILFTNIGLPSTSFSVYQPYLVAIPGVGHAGGSVILSVRTFVSLVAMFFVARYYSWLNCRIGAFVASICVAIGFGLYALNTESYAGLCVASVFTGLGYGLGGMICSTMLIGRWFETNVATVAGIAAVGSGVAAVVLPPIVVVVVNVTSLSAAFALEAALALLLGLLVFALLRNFPEDMGLKPYVSKKAEKGTGKPKRARVNRDVPHSFLPVLMVAMVFVGCASVGGNGYLGVLFTSEGFSTEAAAALIAVSGACLMVSKLFNGVVFDAIGTRNGSVLFFLLFIGGAGLLCLSDMGSSWLATAAAVMFGLGLSLGTVGISVWSIELAPKGREVQTIRNFQICYALGGFIFMLLPGFLAEAFGTYLVSYAALFFMLIAAAAVIVGLYTICDLKAARNGKDR